MNLPKLFGGVLLLLSACYVALSGSGSMKKNLSALEIWITLITKIRRQIDCFLLPVGDIFRSEEAAFLQLDCRERTSEALLLASKANLSPSAYALLSAFCDRLGTSFREDQLALCDETVEKLKEEYQTLSAKAKSGTKVLWSIALTLSLSALILLW